ncbi:hypothetical protein HPB52_005532 [Rhipicephalus sanguineus]|uniref:DUF1758 domain-containing protein n=1 Tax=Rhipicephalus sanguineus TaxID=34632 RepID=A0A9D4Q517_RHISA|nr:hypothetical protein HPB52_005532 [Rhipicephalus sanguineus]
MYREKTKKKNCASSIAETLRDRSRQAKEILTFLRIQVEIRQEGRLQSRRRRHLTILCELSRPAEGPQSNAEYPPLHEPPPPTMRTVTTAQKSGCRLRLVRMLFDSSSQRTYIHADVARILKCSVVGKEELSLVTFGGSKARRRICTEHVNVRLHSQFDESAISLEALTIPEICAVTRQPLGPNLLEREYNVADSFQPNTWQAEEISVIIAWNTYWQVTIAKIDHISTRITSIDTTIGWMAQGLIKCRICTPSSALFVSSRSSATEIEVYSTSRFDAIGIDGTHSRI